MKKYQRGVSLSGLLMGSVILVLVALLGMKLFPDVTEYFQIVKAVKAVSNEAVQNGESVGDIRKSFDRRAQVDDIRTITGQDLEITKDGSQVIITFAYPKTIPLFANVSLLIDFEGSSAKQ